MTAPYLLPEHRCATVAEYRAAGMGDALVSARRLGADALLDALVASGLRTRDDAAVGLGAKWRALVGSGTEQGARYVVANATDAEPGSFTDRALLRVNPLGVVEGIAVAAFALGATDAFVIIRQSFTREYELLTAALAEAEMAGWFEHVSVKCVRAPDAYLLIDDRAVLEVIEGRDPLPLRPPPEVAGLFSTHDDGPGAHPTALPQVPNPTVVESPETLVNVAAVATAGAAWFRSMGTKVSPGNLLCTITGDVAHHGVAEVELGRPLVDVLEEFGRGFVPGPSPKAVLSGVSSPVLTRSRVAAPLSWEGMSAVGARVGRAAFHVYGDERDMVAVAHQIAAYLYVESCGACPACKFGGGEATAYLARIVAGTAEPRDMEALMARLATVTDGRRCDLALRQRDVVTSILRAFPGDVTATRSLGEATPSILEPLVDIVDGRAVRGDGQSRKRADGVVEDRPVQLTRW